MADIHYMTCDPDAMWADMCAVYRDAGGDTLYPGDEKEHVLRGVQHILLLAYAATDHALRMHTLRYAVGNYLDLIGEQRACTRIQAAAAVVTADLTFVAAGTARTLPAGTALTADGVLYWETAEDIAVSGSAETISTTLNCRTAGTAGNSMASGTELQTASSVLGLESAVTTAASAGGVDREDDTTYRARIRAYGLAAVTTGPASQYEASARAADAHVLDANAVNGGDGVVDVYLLLSDGATPATVIANVEAALNADDARPLTDTVNVSQCTTKLYTIYAVCTVSGEEDVQSALESAIAEYQSWQDYTIGQPFNPDKLMALLYQAGAEHVSWGAGSAFDGGTVQYTEIDPDERCKGTITLTVTT